MPKRYRLVLAAWALAQPAWAEGGAMYPPEGVIALWLFGFAFGIPLALAGVALGLLRLLRPQLPRRFAPVFGAAWLVWAAGMLALLFGYKWGVSEDHATVIDGLLSFGAALAAAWRMGRGAR